MTTPLSRTVSEIRRVNLQAENVIFAYTAPLFTAKFDKVIIRIFGRCSDPQVGERLLY